MSKCCLYGKKCCEIVLPKYLTETAQPVSSHSETYFFYDVLIIWLNDDEHHTKCSFLLFISFSWHNNNNSIRQTIKGSRWSRSYSRTIHIFRFIAFRTMGCVIFLLLSAHYSLTWANSELERKRETRIEEHREVQSGRGILREEGGIGECWKHSHKERCRGRKIERNSNQNWVECLESKTTIRTHTAQKNT